MCNHFGDMCVRVLITRKKQMTDGRGFAREGHLPCCTTLLPSIIAPLYSQPGKVYIYIYTIFIVARILVISKESGVVQEPRRQE